MKKRSFSKNRLHFVTQSRKTYEIMQLFEKLTALRVEQVQLENQVHYILEELYEKIVS